MQIKPHRKLLVKQWLILLSVSLLLALVGILLQFLVPLIEGVTSRQVTAVLWPITLGVVLIMWAISAPIVALWIKNLAYVIEEDRITIYKGILNPLC